MSILSCACIGVMHVWALYWNWAHLLLWFQCTSVTRSVSAAEAVIDDLGCAAYSSSTDDVLWPCCLCQQPLYTTSLNTSSTQLCLRWCSAHLSAVLELGTYDVHDHHMIIVHSHKIFVYLFTWSSTWWAGICSILHHHSCWNGLSSLCFWASKTYTLWQNDRYGCFKMKRHYGNSSLNLSINCEEWQVNNHSRIKMHYVIHHWHSRFKAKEWQVYRQCWLPMHHVISHRQKWQIGSHACMIHSCLLTRTKAWTPNSARTIKMMLSFVMSTALWMKGS